MNAIDHRLGIEKLADTAMPAGYDFTIKPPRTLVQSTKLKAERDQLVRDIAGALAALPIRIELEKGPRDCSLQLLGLGISADVWIGIDERPTDVPIISWFKAAKDLKAVPGAWTDDDLNTCHFRKATSHPTSFSDLIERLVIGFTAARDGTAFQ